MSAISSLNTAPGHPQENQFIPPLNWSTSTVDTTSGFSAHKPIQDKGSEGLSEKGEIWEGFQQDILPDKVFSRPLAVVSS
jgi:hypothetical protein